ncbi:MAG TPA: hypothetical protein VGG25_19520 [Streptosporangiaceae bacterium]
MHRPLQPDELPPGLDVLPAYVRRGHDERLAGALRAAAEGASGAVVLVGGSSTGKTRACWEALALLRDEAAGWRVWHPVDPGRPEAALAELARVGPRTVVWLNEAQFYLLAGGGAGERVAAGLRELLRDAARGPVLVLATLWPEYWARLAVRPAAGSPDSHAQARELLAGRDIAVPGVLTPAEVQEAAAAGDPRLALAAGQALDGEVIQFLAGAPELISRYESAPPAARALLDAAVDARRMGLGPVLSREFLEDAAPGYLTDVQWQALPEDWPGPALAYTAAPCNGVAGPLAPARPRRPAAAPGPAAWRMADYLEQHGRRASRARIPPDGFWRAAARHADPASLPDLAHAAEGRGLLRDAARLRKKAAWHGDAREAAVLVRDLQAMAPGPADHRPAQWAVAHASLDDPYALAALLDALRKAGAVEQAAALATRAVARAPLDDPSAVARLLDALREAGAGEQATALAARGPAACAPLDNPRAVARLVNALREAGADEQATALAARGPAACAPLDDLDAVMYLVDALREAGAVEQAAALATRAAPRASFDHPNTVTRLVVALREAGAGEQLTELAIRAVADSSPGNPHAVTYLVEALREAGAVEQLAALAARAPLDNPQAVTDLVNALRNAGAVEQLAVLAARGPAARIRLEDLGAVGWLIEALQRAGADEQATALATRAATHVPLDDPGPVSTLLDDLRSAGADEQLAALAARGPAARVRLDDPGAVADLVGALRRAGAGEQATALAIRAAAHVPFNEPLAARDLAKDLRRAGADKQARELVIRAAARAPLDDALTVERHPGCS